MQPTPADPSRPTGSLWLEGLRRRDASAWRRLTEVYGPLVYAWCRRAGLAAQDAPDAVQEVFRAVAENLERFTHQGDGSFRAWLRVITRNKVHDRFRAVQHQPAAAGGSEAQQRLDALPQPDEEDEPSERALLVRVILERLESEFSRQAWGAFYRMAVANRSSAEVARELGMTPEAVRQAKRRILRRLRLELEET
jgi:RNA polymerase sigma-70 factor (ECF subfamily)